MTKPTLPILSKPDTLTPFRFFCQRVLPAVYSDELSYYELLCKIAHYLNKTMENVNEVNENYEKLLGFLEQLYLWIDNYFENLDIDDAIDKKLQEMLDDGTLETIIKSAFLVKDLGKLSSFRWGYLPPAGFDVDQMLNIAQADKTSFKTYNWKYANDPDNQQSSIPMLTNEPYEVLNKLGVQTTCSSFICDVLYKCGYTDLAGDTKWIGAPQIEEELGNYLVSKGWEKTDDITKLVRGSIVAQGRRSYGAQYPDHCFIYVNSNSRYDCGSTPFIRSGGLDPLNWSNYMNNGFNVNTVLNSTLQTGFYRFQANYPINQTYNDDTALYPFTGIVEYVNGIVYQRFACSQGVVERFSSNGGYTWTERYLALSNASPTRFYNPNATIPAGETEIKWNNGETFAGGDTTFINNRVKCKWIGLWFFNLRLLFTTPITGANNTVQLVEIRPDGTETVFCNYVLDPSNAMHTVSIQSQRAITNNNTEIAVKVTNNGDEVTLGVSQISTCLEVTRLR